MSSRKRVAAVKDESKRDEHQGGDGVQEDVREDSLLVRPTTSPGASPEQESPLSRQVASKRLKTEAPGATASSKSSSPCELPHDGSTDLSLPRDESDDNVDLNHNQNDGKDDTNDRLSKAKAGSADTSPKKNPTTISTTLPADTTNEEGGVGNTAGGSSSGGGTTGNVGFTPIAPASAYPYGGGIMPGTMPFYGPPGAMFPGAYFPASPSPTSMSSNMGSNNPYFSYYSGASTGSGGAAGFGGNATAAMGGGMFSNMSHSNVPQQQPVTPKVSPEEDNSPTQSEGGGGGVGGRSSDEKKGSSPQAMASFNQGAFPWGDGEHNNPAAQFPYQYPPPQFTPYPMMYGFGGMGMMMMPPPPPPFGGGGYGHGMMMGMNPMFIPSRGIPLALQCDLEHLSEYQIMVRQQLELFEATAEDVESNTQGRKKAIAEGQVGLRCKHCAVLPLRARSRGAVYYPSKLQGIYQAAQNMASSHLSVACQTIPPAIREEMQRLRARKDNASGGKQYWADGCRAQQVIETESGLRFHRPTAENPPT